MAHLVESMAYAGRTPWHGLGNQLAAQQPLNVWMQEAGMDWEIRETPVRFISSEAGSLGQISSFPDQKVLFRSDNQALQVVEKGLVELVTESGTGLSAGNTSNQTTNHGTGYPAEQ